mmetsp:Transcript_30356/g.100512  ORF Transcript_30356/g.100512 Transcript_30356/m.100512 type:complete len:215 (+) Transcript_30356:448-1092(+)
MSSPSSTTARFIEIVARQSPRRARTKASSTEASEEKMAASGRGAARMRAATAARATHARQRPATTQRRASCGREAPRACATLIPTPPVSEPVSTSEIHITRYDAVKTARSRVESDAANAPTADIRQKSEAMERAAGTYSFRYSRTRDFVTKAGETPHQPTAWGHPCRPYPRQRQKRPASASSCSHSTALVTIGHAGKPYPPKRDGPVGTPRTSR